MANKELQRTLRVPPSTGTMLGISAPNAIWPMIMQT